MELIRNYLNKNKLASAFIIYLIGAVLLKGIGFITTPIFTRILSTSDYGIVSVFRTWVAFFTVFIGLQVSGSIAIARVHKKPEEFDSYMKSIVVLSLLTATIISIVGFLFKYRLHLLLEIDENLIPHMLVQAYGAACATVYIVYTIQTKQPKKNVIFSAIVTIATVILSIVLILNFEEDKYLGRIYGGTIIYVVVILFIVNEFIFKQKTKVFFSDWKYSIALGAPLIVHLLSNIIIGQSDRLFLMKLIGFEAAAIYTVAYTIGTIGMIIAEVSNNVWSPWYLDNTKASNNKEINDAAKKYVLAISGVFISVMLVSPEIIKIMAPKEYWIGINSLIIITASVYFQFLYRFPLAYEQFSRNLKWVAICTISSALINMALNYVLIGLMGMIGAAVATFVSYVILFGMHEIVARKIIKGFNISLVSYLPGILGCMFFAVIAYLTIEHWYLRYSILFLIVCLAVILFLMKKKSITLSIFK